MEPAVFDRLVRSWLGVNLTDEQVRKFFRYRDLLLEWNQRMNLTGHRSPERVVVYGFLDSLSLLKVLGPLPAALRVVDVGTGAGFPGLPLKLAQPHIRLTLVESSTRVARFLREALRVLGLEDVTLVVDRAERVGRDAAYREQFDLAVARGVALLPELLEYLLPLVRLGGLAVAYKGPRAAQEVEQARKALEVLGGRVRSLARVEVPHLPAERVLVLVEKVAATPPRYPRKPGIPHKRPLG